MQRTELDLPLAAGNLGDDGGNHRAGGLARAVGIERAQDNTGVPNEAWNDNAI